MMPTSLEDSSALSQLQRAQSQVDALLAEDRPLAAAKYLWRASSSFPEPARHNLRLQAIDILFDSQNIIHAHSFLSRLSEDELNRPQLLQKRLFNARFMAQTHRPLKVLELLPASLIRNTPPTLQRAAYRLIAPAAAQAGDIVRSVQSYTALRDLEDETAPEYFSAQVWSVLSRAAPDAVRAGLQQSLDNRTRAWLQLALIATPEKVDQPALEQALANWKSANAWAQLPETIDAAIRQRWRHLHFDPQQIALLLPLTGEYSEFGRAVEAGFTRAAQASSPTFSVHTYNTDQDIGIAAVYRQAVDDGAELIIGPLLGEHVNELVGKRVISIPTLSLNYYHGDGPIPIRDYIQFGLLPEDEAVQVARRMWDDGQHHIALLAPNNTWGARLSSAFTDEYLRLGGGIQQTWLYNPTFVDYSADIQDLLKLDDSKARQRLVSDIVDRPVRWTPRIRPDIRAIALFADAKRSILLYPQLKYHYADALPVYASSHIYDPQSEILRELDGILYCELPAMLQDARPNEKLFRLHALGSDAYNLINLFRLIQIADVTYAGQTGRLSLTRDKRIFRTLQWARFARSRPVPLRYAN